MCGVVDARLGLLTLKDVRRRFATPLADPVSNDGPRECGASPFFAAPDHEHSDTHDRHDAEQQQERPDRRPPRRLRVHRGAEREQHHEANRASPPKTATFWNGHERPFCSSTRARICAARMASTAPISAGVDAGVIQPRCCSSHRRPALAI
jgi:hypothetical protein